MFGFLDGIIVFFVFIVGFSFLGKMDIVIIGGLVELCVGSISMGIGGYFVVWDECNLG